MRYLLIILSVLLMSGCDTYEKVKTYPELVQKVKRLEQINKKLIDNNKDLKAKIESQNRNGRIFKSLISKNPKDQILD